MSAELGGAYFLSAFRCMLVVPRANHPFQHVFGFSRRVCVCVCVCVFSCRPWGLQEVTASCPSLSDIDPESGGQM